MKAGKAGYTSGPIYPQNIHSGTVKPILSPRDRSCRHETLANSMMLNNIALEYITQLETAGG
jgi:hypothetical protein